MTMLSEVVVLVSYVEGSVPNDSFRAWSFTFDKHVFYVMHIGHDGTLVYDVSTQQWLDWDTSGYDNWNAENGVEWNGQVYFGDNSLPILWRMDPNSFLDDDFRLIVRTVTGALPSPGRETLNSGLFVLDMTKEAASVDNQSTPYVQLFVSDNGGFEFTPREQIVIVADELQDFTWRGLGQIKKPGRVYRIVDSGGIATIRGANQYIDGADANDD